MDREWCEVKGRTARGAQSCTGRPRSRGGSRLVGSCHGVAKGSWFLLTFCNRNKRLGTIQGGQGWVRDEALTKRCKDEVFNDLNMSLRAD